MQTFRTALRVAAAAALTLSTVGLTTAGVAAASPAAPPGVPAANLFERLSPTVQERMAGQLTLVDAASVIRSAVEAGEPRGYAGLGLVDNHVTLWWKGAVPADIAAAVRSVEKLAEVRVEPARYSGKELQAAAVKLRRVVAEDRSDAAHTVRIRTDGSGLEVAVDTAGGAKVPALPATGVKTSTVVAQKPEQHATRFDDDAPWNGGARIWNGGGDLCTSGFGVRDLADDTPYVLTAAHCGPLGGEWFDGVGEPIGFIVERHGPHDIALISAASAGSDVYVGGLHESTRVPVAGWTQVFPGQILCQSGQTTAEIHGAPICNLEVQFHYTDEQDLVEATQLDGGESGYGGDSGGPVYQVKPDGSVLAAGTHTSGLGSGIGFQDFATVRDDFGDIVPVTATAGPATCQVSYQVTTWSGGYTANVTIYNWAAAINGWQLAWNLSAGSTITTPWNAGITQNGPAVTASNLAYNASIPSGGAVTFGFNATGTPNVPSPITLNGQSCA
ncbi:cellulose binding domain-containing protein [Verrucosispora sp. WMMD573]|uniref:cellulose binding domain-containing protein n=1 Tax=Verrucosispora sp. WMMD573 TaxID=3015149 RepID=UPI00248C40F2|nr:cellulose binding domain-containing protein [Verrucosispora sp. WMMD573]WBB53664.1 cellulose binding domain-containing protein [Verrucosispora sp. WMMD573]